MDGAQTEAVASGKLLEQQALKVWGQVDGPANDEYWNNAVPVDMTKYLEPGTTISPHQVYKGVTYAAHIGRGVIEAKVNLKLNDNDVIVASNPKTGTTWVQEIAYSLMHKDEIDKPLTEPIDFRVPYIEFPECGFKAMQERPSPRLLKTHAMFQMLPSNDGHPKYKIIYSARNPKDTAISLFYFYKMMHALQFNGTLKEFMNLFYDGITIFGPYAQSVLSYWNQRHLDNVLIVKYEDLQKDFRSEVCRMAKFLEIEVDDALLDKIYARCSFKEMSTNPKSNHAQWTEIENLVGKPNLAFMRKGKVGDWRNHFDEEANKEFDEWIEKNFGKSDITFDYEL